MNHALARRDLPNALSEFASLERSMAGRRPVVFTDYDGVLTPIVATPDLAVLDDAMREAVEALASVTTLAVISGRDLADVRDKVAVDGIHYAGSHGFDIVGPGGEPAGAELIERFAPYLAPLASATDAVERALGDVDGTLVERKRFATAIHYRNVARDEVSRVSAAVERIGAQHPELEVTSGKEIFEYRPDFDWDKGRALEWLIETMGIDLELSTPLYLGDDATDEDAFRSIRDVGVGVVVGLDGPDTLARFSLSDCDEVRELLERIASKGDTGG